MDDSSISKWISIGLAHFNLKRYPEALCCFEKVIEINPADAYGWGLRGDALYGLNRYSEALFCYDKVIEIDPSLLIPSSYGSTLYNIERYSEALPFFDKSLDLEPLNASLWSIKGKTLYRLDRNTEALFCFEKSLEIDPSNPGFNGWKGNILYRLGLISEALPYIDKFLKHNPLDADFLSLKGSALCRINKNSEALQFISKALELDPKLGAVWELKGEVLFHQKYYDKSHKCFDKAIEINPFSSYAWLGKGILLGLLEDTINARSCIFRSIYLNMNHNDSHMNLYTIPASININDVLENFTDKKLFPHFLRVIYKETPQFHRLSDWHDEINEFSRYCRPLDEFILNIENRNNSQYILTKAMLTYFLGNPIETYQIIDREFDINESAAENPLAQYYFALSACDFYEPNKSIINFALVGVQKKIDQGLVTQQELYYTGQLYRLKGDTNNAINYFEKSSEYLPSKYMLTLLYEEERNEERVFFLVNSILKYEEAHQHLRNGFLVGFHISALSFDLDDYWDKIQHYAHFYETTKARKFIIDYVKKNNLSTNYLRNLYTTHDYELYSIWKFLDSCKEKSEQNRRLYNEHLIKEKEFELKQKLPNIFLNWTTYVGPSNELASLVGAHIFNDKETPTSYYLEIIQFLFILELLNSEDTLLLIIYIIYRDYFLLGKNDNKNFSLFLKMTIPQIIPIIINSYNILNQNYAVIISISSVVCGYFLNNHSNKIRFENKNVSFYDFKTNFYKILGNLYNNRAIRKDIEKVFGSSLLAHI